MIMNIVIICCLGHARIITSRRTWIQALSLSSSGSGRTRFLTSVCTEREQGILRSTKEALKSLPLTSAVPVVGFILKLIYGFGFSPGLTGHDSRSRFQSSSWPVGSCLGYPQKHLGLLRICPTKIPGSWARLLQAFSGLAGESALSQNLFQDERWAEACLNINHLSQSWFSFVDPVYPN